MKEGKVKNAETIQNHPAEKNEYIIVRTLCNRSHNICEGLLRPL